MRKRQLLIVTCLVLAPIMPAVADPAPAPNPQLEAMYQQELLSAGLSAQSLAGLKTTFLNDVHENGQGSPDGCLHLSRLFTMPVTYRPLRTGLAIDQKYHPNAIARQDMAAMIARFEGQGDDQDACAAAYTQVYVKLLLNDATGATAAKARAQAIADRVAKKAASAPKAQ